MLLIALLSSAYDWSIVQISGPWDFLSDLLTPVISVMLGHLLLRWPRNHVQTRMQRRFLFGGYLIAPALWLLWDLAWDPAWGGYHGPQWWPTLWHSRTLDHVLGRVVEGTYIVLVVAFIALVALRLAAAPRPVRRELAPVGITAVLLGVTGIFFGLSAFSGLPVPDPVLTSNFAESAIPLSFLGALSVRRIQRAMAVESLIVPGRPTSPEQVERILAKAMGDGALALGVYSYEREEYVCVDGAAMTAVAEGRARIFIPGDDGAPLAQIDLTARLADRPDLTRPVIHAAVTAIEGARARADLRERHHAVAQVQEQLNEATVEGARLSRMLPDGLPQKLRSDPSALGRVEEMIVTVLMSDVRGYSGIAERTPPATLARQLNDHRAAMNASILAEGGTVMQYVGDAVMAVFGAPHTQIGHAGRAIRAALTMHAAQAQVNETWATEELLAFQLGIGISTGIVATALLGSEERYEWTIVGDTVNIAKRLETIARPGGTTVISAATAEAAGPQLCGLEAMSGLRLKGRQATVDAYLLTASQPVSP